MCLGSMGIINQGRARCNTKIEAGAAFLALSDTFPSVFAVFRAPNRFRRIPYREDRSLRYHRRADTTIDRPR